MCYCFLNDLAELIWVSVHVERNILARFVTSFRLSKEFSKQSVSLKSCGLKIESAFMASAQHQMVSFGRNTDITLVYLNPKAASSV